ncbi:MAG TPA: 5-(carboxyamino)imidazole ribonucleotide synthase [Caulobacterales bacterium]|nr:5-(carboxyamino)imidazole ribonucleotide synthase [Caulobacterales bacterium]
MIAPGATIGILGGGQLGRMLAVSAAELGFDVHIFTPEEDSSAARVAARATVAAYEDEAALAAFAEAVDVVTFEFENVPARAAEILAASGKPVRPNPGALAVAQDRLIEKRRFHDLGIGTAPFAPVDDETSLAEALRRISAPAILKTRRLGYDGKGQVRILDAAVANAALDEIERAPAILEGMVSFAREISVVAARGVDGAFAAYDVCENTHRNGILDVTRAPANISASIAAQAIESAHQLMAALDYVGVLAVEYFVMPDGALLANEFAPRVHNSGHWTQDACACSQFEQHIRAVAGWPLGATARLADAEMTNLIGDDVVRWRDLAADPAVRLHLYGKREARLGRKMGHATRLIKS